VEALNLKQTRRSTLDFLSATIWLQYSHNPFFPIQNLFESKLKTEPNAHSTRRLLAAAAAAAAFANRCQKSRFPWHYFRSVFQPIDRFLLRVFLIGASLG
jgi:hypothetical protein